MALSGLVFDMWAWDRQTTDERLHCFRCPTCYYYCHIFICFFFYCVYACNATIFGE